MPPVDRGVVLRSEAVVGFDVDLLLSKISNSLATRTSSTRDQSSSVGLLIEPNRVMPTFM